MAFGRISPPDWWPLSGITTCVVIAIAVLALVYEMSTRKLDPREPPILAPKIPFVGHVLGMAFQGGRYVKNLGLQNRDLPIFTLPVLGSRIYVVTDPSLAANVQRASKVLSFGPIVPEVTERILGLDKPTMEITRRNIDPGPGEERGFIADIQDLVYNGLGPGDYLTEISLDAARELKSEVAAFSAQVSSDARHGTSRNEPIDLLLWVRHFVTQSTAHYLYGSENPLARDPDLEDAFWDFDHGLGKLLMNVLPSITARKAYLGRERLAKAITEYLEKGHHKTGSRIIQKRINLASEHGWTIAAIARSELSFLFAGIVNTTTSTFWILLYIYADPALLGVVRKEVDTVLQTNEESPGPSFRVSITSLKEHCPMLVAVYRESLRLGSDNFSTRLVKENFLLADRHFLKKGSVIQIAGGVIHADESIWGDNVYDFDPSRFLGKQQAGDITNRQNGTREIHPAAFRAFGGGKTLCPGRHFAMNEILAFVALIVLQFDMNAPEGEKIEVPRKNDGVMPVHILEPMTPVKVLISKREIYGDEKFATVADGGRLEIDFDM